MKTILAVAAALALCCLGLLADIREVIASPQGKATKQSPFYCDMAALDPERRARHFEVLSVELRDKRVEVRELDEGYEFDFPSDPQTFQHLAEWIDGERECCPFFDISVRVRPEHGALTMKVTGRPGTKRFIQTEAPSWIKPVRRPAAAQSDDRWIGKPAPDFRLEALGGGTVSLEGLRGSVVLVNFWATWCGPCKVEMPWLAEFQKRYKSDGLVVVGISVDDGSPERVREFVKARNVGYAIALKDASVAQAYGGVRYLPQTFFVDRDGTIVAHSFGITDREAFEAGVRRAMETRRAAA